MQGEKISKLVDKLESGRADAADFRTLSATEWDEIKKLLEMRRRYNMQKYVNALFAYRIRYEDVQVEPKRTYTEQEILSEFGRE